MSIKNKIFLFYTLLFILFTGCSNTTKEYYDNGVIKKETSQIDNRTQKIKFYDENGIIWEEYTLVDSLIHGSKLVYNENGKVDMKINYINGKKNGIQKEYDKQGNLIAKVKFINDKKNGISNFYYPDGKIKEISSFKDDMAHGSAKSYFKNGQLEIEAIFITDTVVYYKECDSLGNIIKENADYDFIFNNNCLPEYFKPSLPTVIVPNNYLVLDSFQTISIRTNGMPNFTLVSYVKGGIIKKEKGIDKYLIKVKNIKPNQKYFQISFEMKCDTSSSFKPLGSVDIPIKR